MIDKKRSRMNYLLYCHFEEIKRSGQRLENNDLVRSFSVKDTALYTVISYKNTEKNMFANSDVNGGKILTKTIEVS